MDSPPGVSRAVYGVFGGLQVRPLAALAGLAVAATLSLQAMRLNTARGARARAVHITSTLRAYDRDVDSSLHRAVTGEGNASFAGALSSATTLSREMPSAQILTALRAAEVTAQRFESRSFFDHQGATPLELDQLRSAFTDVERIARASLVEQTLHDAQTVARLDAMGLAATVTVILLLIATARSMSRVVRHQQLLDEERRASELRQTLAMRAGRMG